LKNSSKTNVDYSKHVGSSRSSQIQIMQIVKLFSQIFDDTVCTSVISSFTDFIRRQIRTSVLFFTNV